MVAEFYMLSLNQTTAQIKLLEAWKVNKDQDYSVHLKKERRERRIEGKNQPETRNNKTEKQC